MRFTAILLLSACLTASAEGLSQGITLAYKDAPLEQVLSAIKKQTGYTFLYKDEVIRKAKKIDISVANASLESVLASCFKDQPLDYKIFEKTIVIGEKNESQNKKAEYNLFIQPLLDIRGRVTNEAGDPVIASVMVKGTNIGTTTGADGRFELKGIDGNATLIISGVSIETIEVKVGNKTEPLNIVVRRKISPLDEVQTIGYGTTSRRFNVGTVSTVTSEQIERQPVTNVLLALQGQVPGLTITPTGGAPGSAVKVQIRGQNTLIGNASYSQAPRPFDQPLFIIDGVPFAAQNNSLGNLLTWDISSNIYSQVPGNGVSPFSSINPADIESISVLRDADATSIYGSQGANGVILITTKKGKPGRTGLSIRANTGVNAATRPLQMMNSQQYLAMRHQALAASGITLTTGNATFYPDLGVFDTTGKYTNWYDQFFDRMAGFTDVSASLSGGQQNSSFFLSGGYTTNSYNFPGDFADNRFSLHSSYTYRSPNNKLSVQFGADYSYTKNNASAQPQVVSAMTMAPNFPDLLDENGKLVWRYKGYSLSRFQQYGLLRQPAELRSHNLNDYLRVSYQIIPDLSLTTLVGYNRTNGNRYTAEPLSVQDPNNNFARAAATFESSVFESLNIEQQLDYKRTIGRGELSVLAGGTYRKTMTSSDYLSGSGYSNDDMLGSISGAASVQAYNTNSLYKYAAGFGRIGFVYDRKYIVNLTGRRDGSSNFGPGRQFGNFGSVGLGWIFSEEGGFQKALPFISFGKLSANYGTTGSDYVAAYQFQPFYIADGISSSLQGVKPFVPDNLFNPDYSWASKKGWNASLELGFLKDRIVTNITWYRNRMTDQLVRYTLPALTGFTGVTDNFPAVVQNTGWEFSIRSTNIRNKDLTWTTNFNISTNRNKLAEFPGLATSPYAAIYQIGQSTSIFNGYRFKGLNETTGLFEFFNKNGTATSNPMGSHSIVGGDMEPLFNLDPKYTGGMDNTVTYKGFTLSIFLQFAEQMTKNYLAGIYSFTVPGGMYNLPAEVMNSWWTKPGDKTQMQKLAASFGPANTSGAAFANSNAAYSNTYYIRLKSLALSWSLPGKWTSKAGIKDVRLNVNAQNLFTVTNYELGDPEQAGAIYSFPMQRTITGGISINF